ncbi:polysaccharide lyase [Hahella sp. HN01]|uniref:polysaccharide lyase n=1 Tax=Hahella sp. HN01 TaxID=2847262 RepID=UPI001C1EB230|nr:polysaccharide lyase [Hahella sp. HN01]MBU6953472.1 polysaccharide lyase [Hahella sp. HN01]
MKQRFLKRLSLTTLLLIGDPVLAATSCNSADFESGDIPRVFDVKVSNKDAIQIQSDIVRKGRYTAKFEIKEGDIFIKDGEKDGFRAELKDPIRARMNETYWYSFSMFIPRDFPVHKNRLVLGQWHAESDSEQEDSLGRSPVLSQRFVDGQFYIQSRHSDVKIQTTTETAKHKLYKTRPFTLGEWNDFVYQVHWSYKDDGLINVWLNGEQIVHYTGPNAYNDDQGPYFKFGLYRDDTPETYTVYYDEYRCGQSRKDVDF